MPGLEDEGGENLGELELVNVRLVKNGKFPPFFGPINGLEKYGYGPVTKFGDPRRGGGGNFAN